MNAPVPSRKGTHALIRVVDLVLLVGTLFLLLFVVGYARPLVIAPNDNETFTEANVLFAFEKANLILIDTTPAFSTAQKYYAEDNLVIHLQPGTYYWKVEGLRESEVRQFTILSVVDLRLREDAEGFKVVNGGTMPLDVDIFDKGSLIGKVVLDTEEEQRINNQKNETYIGGQHDE